MVHWQVGAGPKAQWAVREGKWKLIGNVKDTSNTKIPDADGPVKMFLSNIEDDPGERKNHATDQPDIVSRLKAAHLAGKQAAP